MKVIKIIWGTESDLKKSEFIKINEEVRTPAWSRKWEYPFAILNSESKEFSQVLIAGCGGDFLVDYFLKRKRVVYGVDVLPVPKEEPNFYFHCGDLRKLPFEKETMQEVFCISTLEHIDDNPMVGINELYRVLKKGGQLILTVDYNQNPAAMWKFRKEELKPLCSKLKTKIPAIPADVLRSENFEDGKQWPGIVVLGIIIFKEFKEE